MYRAKTVIGKRNRVTEWAPITGSTVATDDGQWYEEWLEARGSFYRVAFQNRDTNPIDGVSEESQTGDYGSHRAEAMICILETTNRDWVVAIRKREERHERGVMTEPNLMDLFSRLEDSLAASSDLSREALFTELEWAKKRKDPLAVSGEEAYGTLVTVAFFSGIRADNVQSKFKAIWEYLGEMEKTAAFTSDDRDRFLHDPAVIRNRAKFDATIHNAKTVRDLVAEHGSFGNFVRSLGPNLNTIRDDFRRRFRYLGPRTVYHFMMDLGFPVVKPDVAVCRVLHRLGFVDDLSDEMRAIEQSLLAGRRFAEETGHPMRYVDMVLVLYGQAANPQLGIQRGICLGHPRCDACGVTQYCNHFNGLGA